MKGENSIINKKGFTLIEVIIASSILFIISPIFIIILRFNQNYPIDLSTRQNNIGIIQLRRSLSLGINHTINSDSVCMIFKSEEMCFEQYETSLVAYPGTQYFLINVESILFEIIDNWIIISFKSNNVEYEIKLVKI
jgi:prepilin-type N-terminal cleavage/methylation domain-containing protein